MRDIVFSRRFTGGRLESLAAACEWLTARGFSYGRWQRGAPCGVMFGDYAIAKWRNLSEQQQAELHGTLSRFHDDVVVFLLWGTAPAEAKVAVAEPMP